jgi:hypothetical protein
MTKRKEPAERRMRGPAHTKYRGKQPTPLSFKMTPEGRKCLAAHLKRTGYRRGDFLEELVRNHGHRVKPMSWPATI